MVIRDGDVITGFFILKSGKLAFAGFHGDQKKSSKKIDKNKAKISTIVKTRLAINSWVGNFGGWDSY